MGHGQVLWGVARCYGACSLLGTFPHPHPVSIPYSILSPGVKEIDIAATLEHVRDQRPGLVRSKVTMAPCLSLVDSPSQEIS